MNALVEYETPLGKVQLSPDIIRTYLVSGDDSVSDQEVMMFLNLCRYQKLNPFLREVYLIKYGNKPAMIVTGKETFLKRATRNPKYQGHETGIAMNKDRLISAWAKVYVSGYQVPISAEVDFEEYCQYTTDLRTKEKRPNRMWAEKPKVMLKKVALVTALREAFPEDLGGLYSPEEMPIGELSSEPIVIKTTSHVIPSPLPITPPPLNKTPQTSPELTCPFNAHKGKLWTEVIKTSRKYLEWVIANTNYSHKIYLQHLLDQEKDEVIGGDEEQFNPEPEGEIEPEMTEKALVKAIHATLEKLQKINGVMFSSEWYQRQVGLVKKGTKSCVELTHQEKDTLYKKLKNHLEKAKELAQ